MEVDDCLTDISMCPDCQREFIKELEYTNRIDPKGKFIFPSIDSQTDGRDVECVSSGQDHYHIFYLTCPHDLFKQYHDFGGFGFYALRSKDGKYWRIPNSWRKSLIRSTIEWLHRIV